MRTTSRWAWAFASAVLILGGLALMPELREPDCISPAWEKHEIDPPLMEDIEAWAEGDGISVEEAIRRYEWQDDFSWDVSCIEERHPDSYSSADAGYPPRVRFKGQAPKGILAAFRNLPPHVHVVIDESAPYSAREMNRMRDLATKAADAEVGDSGDVALTEVDEKSGEIEVLLGHLRGPTTTKPADVEARIRSKLDWALPRLDAPTITVRVPRDFPWATAG